jgi:hypothetical protein
VGEGWELFAIGVPNSFYTGLNMFPICALGFYQLHHTLFHIVCPMIETKNIWCLTN